MLRATFRSINVSDHGRGITFEFNYSGRKGGMQTQSNAGDMCEGSSFLFDS